MQMSPNWGSCGLFPACGGGCASVKRGPRKGRRRTEGSSAHVGGRSGAIVAQTTGGEEEGRACHLLDMGAAQLETSQETSRGGPSRLMSAPRGADNGRRNGASVGRSRASVTWSRLVCAYASVVTAYPSDLTPANTHV